MSDQPETGQPENLDLRSLDIAEERQQELLRLFPEVRTEGGKLDFAGLQAAYTKHFGTADQPNKPARSAVQVAALANPGFLVEIEATAAKLR